MQADLGTPGVRDSELSFRPGERGTNGIVGTFGRMEPRLIIAYCIIALILAMGAAFIAGVIRRRRKHRQVMSGRRLSQ